MTAAGLAEALTKVRPPLPSAGRPRMALLARVWPVLKLRTLVPVGLRSAAKICRCPGDPAFAIATLTTSARAEAGMPHAPLTRMLRLPDAGIGGPPSGPAGPRESKRRQGVSV